eukprot:TRINITY_DN3279_c0_g1_i1.p1 TRINITY_DN3279_c0_g1~~TRINITY_DN3279_c0_g1_i1.p1  ORF type:complete len:285 (-),score=79.41 TRINITY_DN3279_c0_g1_i1:288-1109(-)
MKSALLPSENEKIKKKKSKKHGLKTKIKETKECEEKVSNKQLIKTFLNDHIDFGNVSVEKKVNVLDTKILKKAIFLDSFVKNRKTFDEHKETDLELKDRLNKRLKTKLSQKMIKKLNLKTFPTMMRRNLVDQMNTLWETYLVQVLNDVHIDVEKLSNADDFAQIITGLDLHGSRIRVELAKNNTLVGNIGIVVQETQNVFRMAKIYGPFSKNKQEQDLEDFYKIIVVPKKGSVFQLIYSSFNCQLYGSQMLQRAVQRSVRVNFKTQLREIFPY